MFPKLLARIKELAGYKGPKVVVGFTAEYAIFVHENLTARHPVGAV